MNILAIGWTFDIIGKILLGVSVLLVHQRIMREHKLDKSVMHEMKIEQVLVIIGIVLMIIAYAIHIGAV